MCVLIFCIGLKAYMQNLLQVVQVPITFYSDRSRYSRLKSYGKLTSFLKALKAGAFILFVGEFDQNDLWNQLHNYTDRILKTRIVLITRAGENGSTCAF